MGPSGEPLIVQRGFLMQIVFFEFWPWHLFFQIGPIFLNFVITSFSVHDFLLHYFSSRSTPEVIQSGDYVVIFQSLSHVQLFCDPPWTVACQVPLSVGFLWQEYWSGLPFASPEDLPDPGIESASPELQADSLPLNHQGSPSMSLSGLFQQAKNLSLTHFTA